MLVCNIMLSDICHVFGVKKLGIDVGKVTQKVKWEVIIQNLTSNLHE